MTTRIILGDCREQLLYMPDDSVQCIVTSPPYWGLRSYLPEGHPDKRDEIGSEPTLQEWVDTMVQVFTECRRVLRPDGTLFLNLGDAYAGSGRGGNGDEITGDGKNASRPMTMSARRDREQVPRSDRGVAGLKPKDMMGQPWRVAFALQASGWWLRQEIIWHKPNPMPESTRDRCTKAHEHVFLLTKSARYYWNFEATQEKASPATHARMAQDVANQKGSARANGGDQAVVKDGRAFKAGGRTPKAVDGASERMGRGPGWRASAVTPKAALGEELGYAEGKAARMAAVGVGNLVETRNPRSVWTIPIHGFKGAHFATFPPALAEKCITAGTKPGDVVLDPFGGAGTVGLVCDRMHRDAILIELDQRSVTMAAERIKADAPLFAGVDHE